MSNRDKGGMSASQKRAYIIDSIEEVSEDILDMIYRIVFCVQSGIE